MYRHVQETVIILGKVNHSQMLCAFCEIFVLWDALNNHQLITKMCYQGAEKKRCRLISELSRDGTEKVFLAYIQLLVKILHLSTLEESCWPHTMIGLRSWPNSGRQRTSRHGCFKPWGIWEYVRNIFQSGRSIYPPIHLRDMGCYPIPYVLDNSIIIKMMWIWNKWLYYMLLLGYLLLLTRNIHLHCGRWCPILLPLHCSYLTVRKGIILQQICICFCLNQYSSVHQFYPDNVPLWGVIL